MQAAFSEHSTMFAAMQSGLRAQAVVTKEKTNKAADRSMAVCPSWSKERRECSSRANSQVSDDAAACVAETFRHSFGELLVTRVRYGCREMGRRRRRRRCR